ncbi:unnamed protein product [Brassica oleracea]
MRCGQNATDDSMTVYIATTPTAIFKQIVRFGFIIYIRDAILGNRRRKHFHPLMQHWLLYE